MFTQGLLQFKQSYATLKTQEQKSTEGSDVIFRSSSLWGNLSE